MADRARPFLLRTQRPSTAAGVAVAFAAVAVATALVYPLKVIAPAVSLGVVYLPAVLLVSAYWGLRLGLLTSLAERRGVQLLPHPAGGASRSPTAATGSPSARSSSSRRWSSTVAELARGRAARRPSAARHEADLAATLARELLAGERPHDALRPPPGASREALDTPSAAHRARRRRGAIERRRAVPLRRAASDRRRCWSRATSLDDAVERLRDAGRAGAGALIAVALHRDAVQAEAVETAALRRSDELKTALLRAVSHDLRTPADRDRRPPGMRSARRR